jgi:trk system potassium uptake protein TrkA
VRAELRSGSALAGCAVAEIAWPRDAILVAVHRGERVIVPRGDVTLNAGDALTFFTTAAGRTALEALLLVPLSMEPGGA